MPAQRDEISALYWGWESGESGMKNTMDYNWRKIGLLLKSAVISRTVTSPPAGVAGACYIIPVGATGDWATRPNQIAVYRVGQSAWEYYPAEEGWVFTVLDEGTWGTQTVFKGGAWSPGVALG